MQRIDLDDMNPQATAQNRESVSAPLDADHFSMNYYALEPGEAFSGNLHTHLDQEEAFLVLEGEATFETRPTPTGDSETIILGEDEMIRFDPGEYQQGRNESDEPLRALALGAPQESSDIRVAIACRKCGESDYMEFGIEAGETILRCPECGAQIEG